jgi:putative glycosyltransferase (TIGR04372 family)
MNNKSSDSVLYDDFGPDSKLVFAFLGSRNIGDFAEQLLTAAAVKEHLEGYRLAVFYNQDRPYKQQIVSLCPDVNIALAGPSGMQFPINIFDIYAGGVRFDDPATQAHELHKSTVILAGNSLPSMCLPSFTHVPRLEVPEAKRQRHETILKDLGLDPNRWFACLYWREPGYQNRPPHPLRDIVDPGPYMAAMDHIVDNLGGQVVRLGHPTTTALRTHPDIVDIAKIDDSLMTQIVAISSARFFISSPSGPLTFGSGFGTPTAVTDNIDISGVWNDHDLLLTQKITTSDGRTFQSRSAFNAGLLKTGATARLIEPGSKYRYSRNSAENIIQVADELHHRTRDCPSWRQAELQSIPTRGPAIQFPLRPSVKSKCFVEVAQ